MPKLTSILASLAPFALAACSATGPAVQDPSRYGPSKGESEFTFAANLTNQAIDTDTSGTVDLNTLFLQAGGGYFIDDNQEVGGQINLFTFDADGQDGQQMGLYPYYRWNFRGNGRGWFYTGGQLGLSVLDAGAGTDTTIGFGVHGGYKHWLQQNLAVFVEPRLNYANQDIGDVIEFQTLFGLAITL